MTRIISSIALLSVLLSCGTGEAKRPGMCAKEPMAPDGIVRLSKIEVYPQYLDEYMKYATEVGEVSLRTEPGVLTMYALRGCVYSHQAGWHHRNLSPVPAVLKDR